MVVFAIFESSCVEIKDTKAKTVTTRLQLLAYIILTNCNSNTKYFI